VTTKGYQPRGVVWTRVPALGMTSPHTVASPA